ncbi:MAG: hypothetical protein QNI91_02955 [Arenicellales bacterium]|nr:hypothetical protein [Arenicellales bacterium]
MMKPINPSSALQRLRRLRHSFDSDSANHKLRFLQILEKAQLRTNTEVAQLHEAMCFMQAYPDNDAVLIMVERMLGSFGNRKDLKKHYRALEDTGITGTRIHYRFYWPTARWLFERWPASVSIDWPEWENVHGLDELWPLLLSYPATEALENLSLSPKQWIETLKRPEETDAAFLIRHFIRWRVEESVREKLYDDLDVPLIISPGVGTPCRTHSRYKPKRMVFGLTPSRSDIPISKLIKRPPISVRNLGERDGNKLIDLARVQMITRARDLYAFMNADPKDVRIVTYESGLQFICYGLLPHRRSLLEAMYVFLILRNGVPIGYTQATTLLRSAEINFNIFDTFRGTEASRIFIHTLAMVRHLFNSDTFVINTQQLGEGNQEALKSGAFWFYHKHGFKPRASKVKRLLRTELANKKSKPGYRSSLSTLKKLASDDLYLFLGDPRDNLVNTLPTENIGLMAAKVLENHASTAVSNGTQRCMSLATSLLGYEPSRRSLSSKRIAWERWSPIVLALPGIARWSAANRRSLIDVINAKGGRRESDFVILFDKHKPLQTAILKLGKTTGR